MDDLEKQIQNALRRKEPSSGFEARVLGAVRRSESRRPFAGWLRWTSAMAAVVVAAGVVWQHERNVAERAAGEAAKARLELALKITSVKLNRIQQIVAEHQNN